MSLFLLLTLAVFGVAPSVRADRDIIFSAQYFRKSGHFVRHSGGSREETLDSKGPYHLYRINPDGTGLTRLTSGLHCLYAPQWSPDGGRILFLFLRDLRTEPRLCLIGAQGGKVSTLARLPKDGEDSAAAGLPMGAGSPSCWPTGTRR